MNPEQERLKEALRLLKLYKLNLFGCFKLACEEANTIRYHPQIHPVKFCQVRATQIAIPLAAILLQLYEVIEEASKQ